MTTTIDDALDGMSARDLERLRTRIDKRLQACVIDGVDGAVAVSVRAKLDGSQSTFSLLLCRQCIERHRLPDTRAET